MLYNISMKKTILTIFIILMFSLSVSAKPINTALYQTMQAQSYRNNYNRQVNYRPIPYWQAQSNYATRNRYYQNQANYSRYMNSVQYSPYRAPYGSYR